MLIYALDSTAVTASVAVCRDEQLLASYTLHNGNTHSETLLPMTETLLDELSLTAADIDLFACTVGPGSFTGIRIGAATIKGLAFASGKPCVGISALESLAANLAHCDGLLCPVIHARKFLYYALFAAKDGEMTRLCEDRIVEIASLEKELTDTLATCCPSTHANAPVYLIGDGYSAAMNALPSLRARIRQTPQHLRDQNAYCIAQLAKKAYEDGAYGTDRELTPVYLRPCQAERDLQERTENAAK